MAGVNVGEDAILGALGVATRDVAPHSIVGGIPAKQLKTKDQATPFKDRSTYKAPSPTGEYCE
jgi:acetyltransferase-like isoleucine patch superfamily enzyme